MKTKIYLKKNEDKRIRNGHLWIFSNEVLNVKGEAENGDIVEAYDSKNDFLGSGFYNKNSLISVRILSGKSVNNFYDFLKIKMDSAYQLRKQLYPERDSFRFVFSESDFLPGLIIDKYNNTFVLQVYSAGIEKNIEDIVKILKEDYKAENIFTKNESHFRKQEHLEEEDKIYSGRRSDEIINDGSIKYKIDFEKGHKTGFYFDQNDNRFFIEKLVKDKTVLDAFCNSGGFGLHAARAGAKSVTFLDSSSNEIENAKYNFQLNNLKNDSDFVSDDVFDFCERSVNENKKFDIVIIDPPAFAKSRKKLPSAKKGYEKLNKLALQLIEKNGCLVTSSCSYHLKQDDFLDIINSAAVKSGKRIKLVHFSSASLDHPQLLSMPETVYLKFAVLKLEN